MNITKEWRVSNYKVVEVGLLTNLDPLWAWFNFECAWTRKQDHPGFRISLEILGRSVSFGAHDRRHWNYEQGRFMSKEDYETGIY